MLKPVILLLIISLTGIFGVGNVFDVSADLQCRNNVEVSCSEELPTLSAMSDGRWNQCIEREMYNCGIDDQRNTFNIIVIMMPVIIVIIVIAVIINKIKNKKKDYVTQTLKTEDDSLETQKSFCGNCGSVIKDEKFCRKCGFELP